MSNSPSDSTTPHLDQVKAEFLAEIEERGIRHVFDWMASWFDKVAAASVADELQMALGEHADNPEARSLHAMDMMMPLATSASNFSTSPSKNLMAQARLSALSAIVDRDWTGAYGSRSHRSAQWAVVRAKLLPPKATDTPSGAS